MKPRPGSRKAAVYDKYFAEGAEAATVSGVALGLAASTVRSWIGVWSKGESDKAAPKPNKAMVTKSRVTISWDPEREAYLLEKGPEVSLIRWADTRDDRFIPNNFIVESKG